MPVSEWDLLVLWLVDDEGNAAGDELIGGSSGSDIDEVNGEGDVQWAKDEAAGKEVGVPQRKVGIVAHGIEIRPAGPKGDKRAVVAIDDGEGIGHDEGFHRQCVGRGNADGDEALPGAAARGCARTKGIERSKRQWQDSLHGGGADGWFKERGGVRDERNGSAFLIRGRLGVNVAGGQQVGYGEVLGGEHAIDSFERELASRMEEV